jgi:hypothetical protein
LRENTFIYIAGDTMNIPKYTYNKFTSWGSGTIPTIDYLETFLNNNPFNLNALPPKISQIITSLMMSQRVDQAAAIHAILSHGAAALSIRHKVKCHHGKVAPIALYSLLVEDSGKGKSPAHDKFVLYARDVENEHANRIKALNADIARGNKIINVKMKHLTKKIGENYGAGVETGILEQKLQDLEAGLLMLIRSREIVSQNPSLPYTINALVKNEGFGHLYFDEVITFNTFPTEASIGELNTIWSGNPISRDRLNQPRVDLVNPRMAMTVLAQAEMLGMMNERRSEQMRKAGLWARFFVVIGDGIYSPDAECNGDEILDMFISMIGDELRAGVDFSGRCNILRFSDDARNALGAFITAINNESTINNLGRLRRIADYTSKAGEHIARFAATIHFIEYGLSDDQINVATAISAMNVFLWSCVSFYRVIELQRGLDDIEKCGVKVLDYFNHRPDQNIKRSELAKFGPNCIRGNAHVRNLVLKYLLDKDDICKQFDGGYTLSKGANRHTPGVSFRTG